MCFFFQAGDGIRYSPVTGVQTCALPIWRWVALFLGLVLLSSSCGCCASGIDTGQATTNSSPASGQGRSSYYGTEAPRQGQRRRRTPTIERGGSLEPPGGKGREEEGGPVEEGGLGEGSGWGGWGGEWVGREGVGWKFGWQEEGCGVVVWTDSDWGGSREDRRSTSGGAVMWGWALLEDVEHNAGGGSIK